MRSTSTFRGRSCRHAALRLTATRTTVGCCLLVVLAACGDEHDATDRADEATLDASTTIISASDPVDESTTTPIPTPISEVPATPSDERASTTDATPPAPSMVPPASAPPDRSGPSAPPIGSDVPIITQPTPDQMCEPGAMPQAAAYDFVDGTFLWVACTEELAWRTVRAVTDDAVYVATTSQEATALDRATGEVLEAAPPPPPREDHGYPPVIEVDGVRIHGEQISRVWATDTNGAELWTRPGGWVYGDVWAIDDGAVFAVEQGQALVAYDIQTGDVRWEHRGDPYGEGLWPWHAEGQRLYSLWGNLQVRSTVDGAVIWATQYPWSGMPTESLHMSGVGTDGERVFVAFAAAGSGGD